MSSRSLDLPGVRHVATLAQMALKPDEEQMLLEQMNKVLGFFEILDAVDTSKVEPMSHSIELQTPFGDDKIAAGLAREAALQNAPDQEEGQIRVPAILEE